MANLNDGLALDLDLFDNTKTDTFPLNAKRKKSKLRSLFSQSRSALNRLRRKSRQAELPLSGQVLSL